MRTWECLQSPHFSSSRILPSIEQPAEMAEAYASGRQSSNHRSMSPFDDDIPSMTVREADLSCESEHLVLPHSRYSDTDSMFTTALLRDGGQASLTRGTVPSATGATDSIHSSSSSILPSSRCFSLIPNTSSLSQSTTPLPPLSYRFFSKHFTRYACVNLFRGY